MIPQTEVTIWIPAPGSGPYLFNLYHSELGRTEIEKYEKISTHSSVRTVVYLIDHYINSVFFFLLRRSLTLQ